MRKCSRHLSLPYTILASSSSSFNNENNKSIDEYVLNVHGGKYRFDEPSVSGTTIGRDFAQSLYSSSSYTDDTQEKNPDIVDWPKWAKRMISISSKSMIPTSPYCYVKKIAFPQTNYKEENFMFAKIQNQYRTWEPFYAKIIALSSHDNFDTSTISSSVPFEVVGSCHGTLSPEGGSDNLCDSNKPYSDSATFSIKCKVSDVNNDELVVDNIQWCLVAGTEEETWYFLLDLP